VVEITVRSFKCSYEHVKLMSIFYNQTKHVNYVLSSALLLKAFCLPIMFYAIEAKWSIFHVDVGRPLVNTPIMASLFVSITHIFLVFTSVASTE